MEDADPVTAAYSCPVAVTTSIDRVKAQEDIKSTNE
jgi:hypothetical protein